MRKYIFIFFLLGFGWMNVNHGEAAEAEMAGYKIAEPHSAIISPVGARLFIRQKLPVISRDGHAVLELALPGGSQNFQVSVPGETISRWSIGPAIIGNMGHLVGRRVELERERQELTIELMAVNTRLALWQVKPNNASAQELEDLQKAIQKEMPLLATRQAELEGRLKLVQDELARIPDISALGEMVSIELVNAPSSAELVVEYSYYSNKCGWEAIYDFDARPDEGSGIDVRFMAEVWQLTGLDWQNTQITLATRGIGPREPEALPEWIVESVPKPVQPRVLMMKNRAAGVATMEDAAPEVAAMAPVIARSDTTYATWTATERGLPQGRSRLQIDHTTWDTPMQWLARPSQGTSEVWLFAKYNLPAGQVWPAGRANYSVSGQSAGTGPFRPGEGIATLYFGPDPRVTVRTVIDERKQGKAGLINSEKTWAWAWTYILDNRHEKPVRVIVERPAPNVVEQEIKVSIANNPAARIENNVFHWDVDVPAGGNTRIESSVTLTAPAKMQIYPVAP